MIKNNVTRLLDSRKIPYEVFESEAVKHSALESAAIHGLDPMTVYKTIVVFRLVKGKPILAVVPGPFEVDPKKVAAVINEKKVRVSTQKEAEEITGLLSGGISALALLNKGFQVFLHTSASDQALINVSGGQRGLSVRLSPKDFLSLTNAKVADIASPSGSAL